MEARRYVCLVALAALADAKRFTAIDAHVHLITTTNGITYEWAKDPASLQPPEKCPCRPPCLCNWTAADYHATSASSWDVEKVVFCEVDADPSEWLEEVKWVQASADHRSANPDDAAASGPAIGAIVAHPPPGFGTAPVASFSKGLDELAKLPLVTGLRSQALSPDNTSALELDALNEVGRRGWVFDINMPLLNGVVEDKVRSCPGTRFVLEHLAAATTTSSDPAHLTAYTAAVESIAKLPNVECIQLGGVASQWGSEGAIDKAAVGAYVKAAINAFGFSRVCFEGNWFFNNCIFI